MSLFTLLLFVVVVIAVTLVVRRLVRVYRRPKFPVFSITMLGISLVLLIVGTILSLTVSDAIGGAISTLGGFFGLLESHVRHKREEAEHEMKDSAVN